MASYDRAILDGSGISLPRGVYVPKSEYIDQLRRAGDKRNIISLQKDRDRILTIRGIETPCDITYFPWRFLNLEGQKTDSKGPNEIVKGLQENVEDFSNLLPEIKKSLITDPEDVQVIAEIQLRNMGKRGLYKHWADNYPVGHRYHDAIRKYWYSSLPMPFVTAVQKYCEGKADQEIMEFQSLAKHFRRWSTANPTNRGIITIADLTQEEILGEVEGFLVMDTGDLPNTWQKGGIYTEVAKIMLEKADPIVKIKMRNAAIYNRYQKELKKRLKADATKSE